MAAATATPAPLAPMAMGEATASLQRACAGLEEDLMLAMLGSVQALAGTCAAVCAERLQMLHQEMTAAFEADLQRRCVALASTGSTAAAAPANVRYFGEDCETEEEEDGEAEHGLEDMYDALSAIGHQDAPEAAREELAETPQVARKLETETPTGREPSSATTAPLSTSFAASEDSLEPAAERDSPSRRLFDAELQADSPEPQGKWLAAELGIESSDAQSVDGTDGIQVDAVEESADLEAAWEASSDDGGNSSDTDDFCTWGSDADGAAGESFSKLVESLEPWGVVFADGEEPCERGVEDSQSCAGLAGSTSADEADSGETCQSASSALPEVAHERGAPYKVRAPVALRQAPCPEAPELANLDAGLAVCLFDWDSTRRWRRCWQAGDETEPLCGWLPLEGPDGTPLLWPEGLPEADGPLPPVSVAVYEDNLPHLRGLIADGSDLNAEDAAGRPPLVLAAQLGRSECCALLMEAGAEGVEAKPRPADEEYEADAELEPTSEAELAWLEACADAATAGD
mmetsp:Transcript_29929/g.93613  ORF Transcript_29929/g.93613 Transcript_29929/m.93613 type:complete len:517 (-) Transcript_29929:22-1572(-)